MIKSATWAKISELDQIASDEVALIVLVDFLCSSFTLRWARIRRASERTMPTYSTSGALIRPSYERSAHLL